MLIDPRHNLPFYVGKGKDRRCDYHLWEAKYRTTKNSYRLNKIRKLLSDGYTPIVKKIEENVSDSFAKEFEMLLISEIKELGIKLTNITDGGDGGLGIKHSEESKLKTSLALKGRPSPMKGKVHSIKAREKMSLAGKGKRKLKVSCPCCNKQVAVNTAKRWHFDNCKGKNNV